MANEDVPIWAQRMERQNQSNRIVNQVIQDLFAHFHRGDERPFAVDAIILENYQWHNPSKGETHKGEMDRWFNFIKETANISVRFDHEKDMYMFYNEETKFPNNQLIQKP